MHFSWQISNMTYTRDLFKIKENILLEIWQIIKIIQKRKKKTIASTKFQGQNRVSQEKIFKI